MTEFLIFRGNCYFNAGFFLDSWKARTLKAVKAHSLLLPLISPINLSLFPMTSKTFPHIPHWLHSATHSHSRSLVMSSVHMIERRQKMKVWHITPESFSLLCNALCSSMKSFDFKQSQFSQKKWHTGKQGTTQALLMLSESAQFTQQ